ncbi:hypothetical protein DL95DRAFT_302243 [Leptodontidium sp. 2 PMI_412]|nr:hypothetical protein DL95DRAFT_302243 [Leptodontidium sp. 2 PMI_412]
MSQHQTGRDKVAVAHIEQGIASSRKRQKISLACEECHTRKVRCDGLRPQCSACNRRARSKQPCTYLSEPSRISGNKRYVPTKHYQSTTQYQFSFIYTEQFSHFTIAWPIWRTS